VNILKKAFRDDEDGESALEKVNDTLLEVVSFRPKILGVEVDVNALLKKLRGKKKQNQKNWSTKHMKHTKKKQRNKILA
jgi:hypothetical protein